MKAAYFIFGMALGLALISTLSAQTIVEEFPAPAGESRGLAWGRNSLWCADSDVDSVFKLNPANGEILSSFYFSLPSSYGGLTWSDDDNLWITVGNYFYKVDPTSGEQIANFECPGG